MQTLLVVLTVAEIVVVLAVLLGYLVLIRESLRRTTRLLARVSFGVRAIERQVGSLPPHVVRLNASLQRLATSLPGPNDRRRQPSR